MKRIVLDIDNTLAIGASNGDYASAEVNVEVAEKTRHYKQKGFEIVISSSRNMRTFENNIGKINAITLPVIIDWLESHDIPYDEIWVGKPWCGTEGFYVDDKTIRPDEFVNLSYEQIGDLVAIEKQ